MRLGHFLQFFLLFLLVQNCYSVTQTDSAILTIQGSNTVGAKLAPDLARAYLIAKGYEKVTIVNSAENEYIVSGYEVKNATKKPAVIKIAAHGSSTGFTGLAQGLADIAMSSRPIKSSEVEALRKVGDMQSAESEHAIAIDGLAILVNRRNNVRALTIEQIAKIFSGEITNWSEVGGSNNLISLYARDQNSGTWDTFKELVLMGKYTIASSAQRFESNDELSDKVAKDSFAIGFTGLSSIRQAKVLAVADADTEALLPNQHTVATEDYALSRRLFFYTPFSKKVREIEEFIDFCLSEKGQEIVGKVGYVSQNIQTYTQNNNPLAPQDYQQLASNAQRLSVNFRFENGSPFLDNKAYRDIERIGSFMSKSENSGAKLYLVGFSDLGSSTNADNLISRYRALAVKGSLLEEGVRVSKVYAMGSFIPVASVDNEYSKSKNGRVEVWIAQPEKIVKNVQNVLSDI